MRLLGPALPARGIPEQSCFDLSPVNFAYVYAEGPQPLKDFIRPPLFGELPLQDWERGRVRVVF